MSRLTDLLKDLGADAELEQAFQRDPEGVMDRYEIDEATRTALRREDVNELSRVTGLSDISLSNGTVKGYA